MNEVSGTTTGAAKGAGAKGADTITTGAAKGAGAKGAGATTTGDAKGAGAAIDAGTITTGDAMGAGAKGAGATTTGDAKGVGTTTTGDAKGAGAAIDAGTITTGDAMGAGTTTTGGASILLIGYGNTLRRDDGVGVRAAELIAADLRFDGVDVLTCYQLTPELALDIAAVSLVVFIDADVRGLPGSIEVLELSSEAPRWDADARAQPGSSSHHVGAGELLALARELVGGTPRAVSVGIGVADLELGEGLSAPVEGALPRVIDVVAGLVTEHRQR